jgi:hypothetical protein
MSSKKKRNKPYRIKSFSGSAKLKKWSWRVALTFSPVIAILDQLEQEGTVDVNAEGDAIFLDPTDGLWHDSFVAIMGMADFYEFHERRSGRILDVSPLSQLANKLKCGTQILTIDTQAARACLSRIHAETLEMTVDYIDELVQDFQIMGELQKTIP